VVAVVVAAVGVRVTVADIGAVGSAPLRLVAVCASTHADDDHSITISTHVTYSTNIAGSRSTKNAGSTPK
jgi:hypothetical protein